ncbi:MAG: DUF748 domain-containing protein [Flavobacteriales bacterium]
MKPWRIAGILFLTALLLSAGWAWRDGRSWLDRTVRERIQEVIDRATEEGYRFHMDSVGTDALQGDLLLLNVQLDIDSTLMDSLRNGTHRYLFTARMDRLMLRGVSYWRLLLRHEFRVERLEMDAPGLRYFVHEQRVAPQEPFARLSNGGPSFAGLLHAGTLLVRDAACTVQDISGRLPLMRIAGLDLTVHDLELKVQEAAHGLRVEAGSSALALDSLRAELGSGYRLRIGAVRVERNGQRGSIEQLVLTPPEVAEDTATAITFTTLSISRLGLRGIDLDRLIGDSGLRITTLEVQSMRVEATLDRTRPDPPPRPVQLPAGALLQLGLPVRIDTLRVADGAVHYHERATSGRWGDIPFTALRATITGISNEPGPAREKAAMEGTIACTMLDSAMLTAAYRAKLDGSDDFTFEANVRELPFITLDRLTRPLLQLQVDAGRLHELRLTMKGDDRRARGSVGMTYDGLIVQVEPGTPAAQRHSMFGSIMDNMLRSEHGGGLADDRQRTVTIERDTDRSVLTYIWHFTRAGLMRNLTPAAIERVEQVMRREKQQRKADRALREQQRTTRR